MNLVVCGLGRHAVNKILPAVSKSPKFNLYGVCSRNSNIVEEAKRSFELKGWTSFIEMLKDKNIDAIYLSTPPALHKIQAEEILDSGKHLLCEKPITMSFKDTYFLVKKANLNNLILMEGLMYLYHPHHDALKKLLMRKKLGKLKEIKSSFQLPPLAKPGYRNDKKLGASAVYDLGIYPVSLILDLYDISEIELIDKEINYDKDLNYDISGRAFLKINNTLDCVIDWAYNKTYINEVSIFGEDLKLYSNYVFSKDIKHESNISLYDQTELIENIEVGRADHFELMLKSFSESIIDPQKNKLETKSILDLSSFLNKLIS
ncbi:MAG: gfo/Idh/MocA family oxidoreductase [Flavobacteriaceae bacterium TMED238]|nr:MAG: gfo/Idh/MocA family oxidoreductase [Flavobacteriaceae bacterium TMED238]